MNNVHVVQSTNGWQVKEAGTGRVLATLSTQSEAIAYATSIARANYTEMLIHGRDGKIRERNTFGKDPHPPKG